MQYDVTVKLGTVPCPYAPRKGRCPVSAVLTVQEPHSGSYISKMIYVKQLYAECTGHQAEACASHCALGGICGRTLTQSVLPHSNERFTASIPQTEKALRKRLEFAKQEYKNQKREGTL